LQRELVQKSLHQLAEYQDDTYAAYLKPIIVAADYKKNWANWTAGYSAEELADLMEAQAKIAQYEKVYSMFEYCSDLNHAMLVLENRISTSNANIPMNVYRFSKSTDITSLFPEIEQCLQAYYDLIDDCKEFPDWQRKVRFDLGNTVSYLALNLDESSRDLAVQHSPVYARFDMEKQLYFK